MSKSTPIHSINIDFSHSIEAIILHSVVKDALNYPMSDEMREYLQGVVEDLKEVIRMLTSLEDEQ